jgi:hypothetical protein
VTKESKYSTCNNGRDTIGADYYYVGESQRFMNLSHLSYETNHEIPTNDNSYGVHLMQNDDDDLEAEMAIKADEVERARMTGDWNNNDFSDAVSDLSFEP